MLWICVHRCQKKTGHKTFFSHTQHKIESICVVNYNFEDWGLSNKCIRREIERLINWFIRRVLPVIIVRLGNSFILPIPAITLQRQTRLIFSVDMMMRRDEVEVKRMRKLIISNLSHSHDSLSIILYGHVAVAVVWVSMRIAKFSLLLSAPRPKIWIQGTHHMNTDKCNL